MRCQTTRSPTPAKSASIVCTCPAGPRCRRGCVLVRGGRQVAGPVHGGFVTRATCGWRRSSPIPRDQIVHPGWPVSCRAITAWTAFQEIGTAPGPEPGPSACGGGSPAFGVDDHRAADEHRVSKCSTASSMAWLSVKFRPVAKQTTYPAPDCVDRRLCPRRDVSVGGQQSPVQVDGDHSVCLVGHHSGTSDTLASLPRGSTTRSVFNGQPTQGVGP